MNRFHALLLATTTNSISDATMRPGFYRGFQLLWAVAGVTLGLSGCDHRVTAPARNPDVSHWVAGDAATALDAHGHFIPPPVNLPGAIPTITEARAEALAVAYLNTMRHTPSFMEPLALQHGRAFDADLLRSSSRVEFAWSPYEPTPDSLGLPARRTTGSYFVVRLLVRGVPTVTVYVSAYATEAEIENGRIVLPAAAGGEFRAFGIPYGEGYANPLSPEQAVEASGTLTGTRVVRVPVLIRPDWRFSVAYSKWMLELERDVTVTSLESGRTAKTSVLLAGPRFGPAGNLLEKAALFVATPEQPATDTVTTDLHLQVRSGWPIRFEEVRLGA